MNEIAISRPIIEGRVFKRMTLATVLMLALVMSQTITGHAKNAPESFADLAENLSPSVVNITTTTIIPGTPNQLDLPRFPDGSPFFELFPEFFGGQNGMNKRHKSRALGSGFVISSDGFIVTNNHVIDKADEITIEFIDGRKLKAKLIGRDRKTDIAVLKVETKKDIPFVTFGDSDVSRVGDWVLAIGNPLGQGFTVTSGIISARNRSLSGAYDDFIQTDAAINRGNSGGPLFNMDGKVIGVNTAIISPNGGSIGLGFSMSSNVVSKVVEQLKEFGETRRGWLGVGIQDIDKELADAWGLSEVRGAAISSLYKGPAEKAGAKVGDVVLSFDGKEIKNVRELIRNVGEAKVGKAVEMVVYRAGKTLTLKVVLGQREIAENKINNPKDDISNEMEELNELGMQLSEITPELRHGFKINSDVKGVIIVAVDEESDAFEKGMRRGDVIVEVAQKPVTSPIDVQNAFKVAKDAGAGSILLLTQRNGHSRFIGLALEK